MCEYLIDGVWYWRPLWHLQHCVLKWALFLLQILCYSLSEHRNRVKGHCIQYRLR